MDSILTAALFGMVGGMARACVGYLKHRVPNVPSFNKKPFLLTVIAAGVIGVFCSLALETNFAISLLAGYAGTDIIEGIYKIKKKSLELRKYLKKGSRNKS